MEWQFISGEWTGDKKKKPRIPNVVNTKPVRIGENEAVFGLKKSATGR